MTADLARLSNSFPFGEPFFDWESFLDILIPHFPERLRGWSLCETYFEQFAWSFCPIRRDELIDEYMTPIYNAIQEHTSGNHESAALTPHKCAVLFIVFCIGSWVDLTSEDCSSSQLHCSYVLRRLTQLSDVAEAEKYYHLARACLSMRSVFDSPEIATVHAIALLSIYTALEGKSRKTQI